MTDREQEHLKRQLDIATSRWRAAKAAEISTRAEVTRIRDLISSGKTDREHRRNRQGKGKTDGT